MRVAFVLHFAFHSTEDIPMPTDENRRLDRETLRNSTRYLDFNNELLNIDTYLAADDGANATRLMVPADQVLALANAYTAWLPAITAYLDPNQRNRATIREVEAQYESAVSLVRALQQQLKRNANITLTGEDRLALGVHLDKTTRTRVPRQTVAPLVEEYETKHMENKFRTSYPDSAGDFHRRMPAYNSLLIKVAFTPPDAPMPVEKDYDHITQTGRNRFTITPPGTMPIGTHGYVKCCYVNSRGEMGPESAPLMFLVN